MIGRTGQRSAGRPRVRYTDIVKSGLPAIGLPLLLLLTVTTSACASAPRNAIPISLHTPSPTAIASLPESSSTTAADARSKIHTASPSYIPLFARITFTGDTSYEQAVAILQGHIYPWTCDGPRSNIPPPPAEQQASFAASHKLLLSYPTWDELRRIASSPRVTAVDGTALYPCP